MSALTKPIPALYTVYILRSTVRHASLYIGSTPNPPRRLKQHNGEVKGGAARTSRPSLRPWEMVAIVSGFPGMVAALKFEYALPPHLSLLYVLETVTDAWEISSRWALTNPHLSLHIPSSERLAVFTQRKKNGQPKRPRANIISILSNLHLLLRVPSFARWPLSLHFFDKDVHGKWQDWVSGVEEPLRRNLAVKTDLGPDDASPLGASQGEERPWGIHALPLDYAPLKEYAEKARSIFAFEREGGCVHCKGAMPPTEGLYAVCPNVDCEAVGHLQCWSKRVLNQEGDGDAVVPLQGKCPVCEGDLRWGDMMKELSLRLRGPKELDKLLQKRKRQRKA